MRLYIYLGHIFISCLELSTIMAKSDLNLKVLVNASYHATNDNKKSENNKIRPSKILCLLSYLSMKKSYMP